MQTSITLSSFDVARLERLIRVGGVTQNPVVAALEAEIDRADIVEPYDVPADVVTMNSRVRFVFDPAPEVFELVLSYPHEVDRDDAARLSVMTPIGTALLGLRVGQHIDWTLPNGRSARLRVIELPYQPEREGRDFGEGD